MNVSGYRFLDCGNGRRLESLGGVVVDRPAPAAAWRPVLGKEAWDGAELSFSREGGWRGVPPDDWRVEIGGLVLRLRPGPSGRVGVFPEHLRAAGALVRRVVEKGGGQARALNLFAHTGLATLLLASCPEVGEVAHVDGSAASVRQARENAVLSGLGEKRIRWLVDDVPGFMRREARRGRRYDIVLADPPAFGRGGKGGEWRLARDLPVLAELAGELAEPGGILAVSCHSEGWSAADTVRAVGSAGCFAVLEQLDLTLDSVAGGASLPCGHAVYAASVRTEKPGEGA